MNIAYIHTPYAKFTILWSMKGLRSLSKLNNRIGFVGDNKKEDKIIRELRKDLLEYFSHKPVDFSKYKVDLDTLPEFQRQVLIELRSIPYGKTLSYKQLAQKLGKPNAQRAVGKALSANPLPIIIPCHRVIGKDGKLCGFIWGLKWKERLLKLESMPLNISKRGDKLK